MQIKQIKPLTIFYYSEKTNIAGLEKLTRTVARKLYAEAVKADLEITGPVYWLYTGFDGNPQTLFTIEVALPIQEERSCNSEFRIRQTTDFTCAAITHVGSWYNIPQAYNTVISELTSAGFTMTGHNREIYMYMDFANPANNVTEIQIGIHA